MSENKSQTPAQNTPENSEKKKVSLFALIVVLVVAVIVMVALFVRSNNLSSPKRDGPPSRRCRPPCAI